MAQSPVGLAGRPVICKHLGFGLCKNAILQIYAKKHPARLVDQQRRFLQAS